METAGESRRQGSSTADGGACSVLGCGFPGVCLSIHPDPNPLLVLGHGFDLQSYSTNENGPFRVLFIGGDGVLIKINQPVEITASRQTVTLIADHFGDQIVGLYKACTGRFLLSQ